MDSSEAKTLKTGLRENVRGKRKEREREREVRRVGEEERESIQRQSNKVRGRERDGERLVPVVSPFGPLMWRVTASLTEG